jgi:hypothetical protein
MDAAVLKETSEFFTAQPSCSMCSFLTYWLLTEISLQAQELLKQGQESVLNDLPVHLTGKGRV